MTTAAPAPTASNPILNYNMVAPCLGLIAGIAWIILKYTLAVGIFIPDVVTVTLFTATLSINIWRNLRFRSQLEEAYAKEERKGACQGESGGLQQEVRQLKEVHQNTMDEIWELLKDEIESDQPGGAEHGLQDIKSAIIKLNAKTSSKEQLAKIGAQAQTIAKLERELEESRSQIQFLKKELNNPEEPDWSEEEPILSEHPFFATTITELKNKMEQLNRALEEVGRETWKQEYDRLYTAYRRLTFHIFPVAIMNMNERLD